MRWQLSQIAEALGLAGRQEWSGIYAEGISIDSRTIRPGELFIAIHGPRHDGHTFVAEVLGRGAIAAVVAAARATEFSPELSERLLPVADTVRALQRLARDYAESWRGERRGRRIAAVTGSTGKTTTKEILAALLGSRLRVLKSEGNLNNDYGLPLTLFGLSEKHEAAVVEMGMSARGEIARLARIARPDVGVVTNVAPVHLEFFSSVEEIALAKRELIEGLCGADPVAVLNADDARVFRFREIFRGRVHSYGTAETAEFRAAHIETRGLEGSEFVFHFPGGNARLRLGLAGQHNVMNALGALAAASEWGIGAEEARAVLENLSPSSLRGEILRFDLLRGAAKRGESGFTVINDCYNSNPLALERMIDLLCATPGYTRRVLVAGAWREIGPRSAELHRAAGAYAQRKGAVDWVIGVEGDAGEIVAGAIGAGHPAARTAFFESAPEAAKFLAGFVEPGDLLLVKGSRGVQMEVIASALREKFPLASPSGAARPGDAAGQAEPAERASES